MFLSYCYYLLIVFTKSVIFYVETYVTILCIKINQFIVIVIVSHFFPVFDIWFSIVGINVSENLATTSKTRLAQSQLRHA